MFVYFDGRDQNAYYKTTINKKQYAINGVYLINVRTHQLDTRNVCISGNEYHIIIDKIAQYIDTLKIFILCKTC